MIGVVLVNVPFRPHFAPGPIDDLLNEIPALGLLVGASGLLALAYVRRRPSLFAIAGVLFGALALIKAIFFFVFFALALALAGLFLLQRPTGTVRAAAHDLGLLTLAFLCVVGPWLYRNQVELGTLQIAQRSGEAMMERSLEDQMTAQEYAGAVYLWAPHFRRQLGTWLGLSSRDLLAGGKLERLDDDPGSDVSKADLVFERSGNPERTVTFYRRARAERVRLENELEREASPQPEIEADKLLKTEGVAVFERYPLRHLEASALFWWRGTVDTSVVLLIALIFGMRQRRYDLVLFVLPSLGAAAAYVLATPFFPRYDIPMHFVAIVVVVILAKNFWDIARRRYTTM